MAPLANGSSRLKLGRLMEGGFIQRRLLGLFTGMALIAVVVVASGVVRLVTTL